MGDATTMCRPRTVTDRGEGLTSRAGLWWLAEVADQLGLAGGLRWAMRRLSWRDHHPGTTLEVMILALADGEPREGAEVAGLTDLVNLESWPTGTRLIVRRERAQLSLFDDIEGRRQTALITNQKGDAPRPGTRPPPARRSRRRHPRPQGLRLRKLSLRGHGEQPGLGPVLRDGVQPVVTSQRLTLVGPCQTATRETIRHRLLHIAGRITPSGHRLHLDRDWPWTPVLLNGIHHTQTLTGSSWPLP